MSPIKHLGEWQEHQSIVVTHAHALNPFIKWFNEVVVKTVEWVGILILTFVSVAWDETTARGEGAAIDSALREVTSPTTSYSSWQTKTFYKSRGIILLQVYFKLL